MIGLGLLDASLMTLEGLYRACALLILSAVGVSVLIARRKVNPVSAAG